MLQCPRIQGEDDLRGEAWSACSTEVRPCSGSSPCSTFAGASLKRCAARARCGQATWPMSSGGRGRRCLGEVEHPCSFASRFVRVPWGGGPRRIRRGLIEALTAPPLSLKLPIEPRRGRRASGWGWLSCAPLAHRRSARFPGEFAGASLKQVCNPVEAVTITRRGRCPVPRRIRRGLIEALSLYRPRVRGRRSGPAVPRRIRRGLIEAPCCATGHATATVDVTFPGEFAGASLKQANPVRQ